MRREPLHAAAMVALVVLSGCTSPAKGPPAPNDPTGAPLMEALQGVTYAREYMSRLYAGSDAVHGFTATRRLVGSPVAWDGTGSGNATGWVTYFEGVMYNSGAYRYIQYAVDVHFKGSEVFVSHAKVQIKTLRADEVNATSAAIDAVSLEPYVDASSHDIFVRAEAARWDAPAGYYLQSINMSLNHNITARYAPSTASWEVAYRYYGRSDGSSVVSVAVIDAGTFKLLKVVPPS